MNIDILKSLEALLPNGGSKGRERVSLGDVTLATTQHFRFYSIFSLHEGRTSQSHRIGQAEYTLCVVQMGPNDIMVIPESQAQYAIASLARLGNHFNSEVGQTTRYTQPGLQESAAALAAPFQLPSAFLLSTALRTDILYHLKGGNPVKIVQEMQAGIQR